MNRKIIIRNIYQTINWDQLYELAPEIKREDVDLLFKEIGEMLPEKDEGRKTTREPELQTSPVSPPKEAVLYCDGASKGNPGPAGLGVVIEHQDGKELAAWGKAVGKATNNEAEYMALLDGLEKAFNWGIKKIEIRTDSQLMARQLNGRYRVKSSKLKPLFTEVKSSLDEFDSWRIKHLKREHNTKADKLASKYAKRNK